jgi:dGTPase
MNDSIRLRLEHKENQLAPYAVKVFNSKGRMLPEKPSLMRTDFQRDRDRIVHSKAFRRIKHKTQVFIAPKGDHYVTRLTHTLEVSQIARTISRALNLNEDLTEAMSLAHDIGHTPFGHLGEELLDQLYSQGFRHNEQSLKIVDRIEKNGKGLNLTYEVRQGILHHSKPRGDFMDLSNAVNDLSLESQVLRVSDAIAYLNHDLLDSFRANILSEDMLPSDIIRVLGDTHSKRINTMITDIVDDSLNHWQLTNAKDGFYISMSDHVKKAVNDLRQYMFHNVYLPEGETLEAKVAKDILILLFEYLSKNHDKIPIEYGLRSDSPEEAVIDYISGMTDNYAINMAENIQPNIANVFRKGVF